MNPTRAKSNLPHLHKYLIIQMKLRHKHLLLLPGAVSVLLYAARTPPITATEAHIAVDEMVHEAVLLVDDNARWLGSSLELFATAEPTPGALAIPPQSNLPRSDKSATTARLVWVKMQQERT